MKTKPGICNCEPGNPHGRNGGYTAPGTAAPQCGYMADATIPE